MKKTSTLLPLILLVFIGCVSSASSMEADERAQTQVFNTFRMIHSLWQGFQKAFNPPASPSELEADDEDFPKRAEAVDIMRGSGDSTALFARAPEFVAETKSTHPNLKSSDYRTMAESAVRVGMKARPQHFSPLEEGPMTPDTGVAIFSNFFQEFTQEGALDGWLSCLNRKIEEKESDGDSQAACQEFANSLGTFLKQIALNDPAKSPLNKYVDPDEFQEACDLHEWLEKNQGHRGYDKKHSRFIELDKRIQAARDKAMYEGGQYIFDLLKRIQPELAPMREMSEVIEHQKTQWALAHRAEFEAYILTEYGKLNPFESNRLRSFWEKLEGHQYGKLCYRIVCESFEGMDSPVHKLVQQIWAVSQLDTIHKKPKEARSRMPAESVDGAYAPNFGYRMKDSTAYKAWITNPLARASGDVIMDAYHSMVSFSRELNTDLFLKRFKKYLSYKKKDRYERASHPHKYDRYMIAFERYLLERIFHKSIIPGQELKRTQELKNAAGSMENLMTHASTALVELKKFSDNMFALRPTSDAADSSRSRGLVFGIGFNGALFNSPNPSGSDKDEIWLTFSDSGRNEGGYLLLSFMKDVAELPSNRLAESLPLGLSNFDKYKPLMRKNISQRIKDLYDLPDSHWDSYMLRYIKREREKLEDFMWQLEQKLPFSALDPKLQAWIKKTSNWYRVPPQVSIKIADELDPKEHQAQHAARELLFDAVARRSFSREYPSLVPHLFLHWKDELLERMEASRAEAVRAIERLRDVPEDLQGEILELLDQTVGEVHPALKAVWQPEIVKQFQEFMKLQREPLEDRKKKTAQKIKGLGKNLSDLAKSHSDVSAKIEEVKKALREAEGETLDVEQRMRELPTAASELTRDQYEDFRSYFFQKRDVSQCVESLFAKVLGHDRFFSVFISNKPGIAPLHNQAGSRLQLGNRIPYDVIAPCDKNCQHHALGHLYVGDMLCHQSVDHLDYIRQIHGLEGVTDRFIRLGL